MKTKFIIPTTMTNVVKELILNTESMDDEERQYWFDIWDYMNESQQKRLQEILQTEKDKLDALEKRYQEKIYNLNLKNLEAFEFDKETLILKTQIDTQNIELQSLKKQVKGLVEIIKFLSTNK